MAFKLERLLEYGGGGEDEDGNLCLPSGDPLLVPYKHMWHGKEMNTDATNVEKEVFKATQANNAICFYTGQYGEIYTNLGSWQIRNDSYVSPMT